MGLYGLYLLWRAPRVRGLVLAGFAALPVLWLAPEWWGSGDPLRAMHRAQNPRASSPAFADDPVRVVLEQFNLMLTPVFWAGLAALGFALLIRWPPRRDLLVVGGLALAALILVAEVAFMTADGGFSGNIRYLVMPAAALWVVAGVGVGWLVRGLLGEDAIRGGPLAVGLAVAAGIFFTAPTWTTLPIDRIALDFQADLNDSLPSAVARAGAARAPARVRAAVHGPVPGADRRLAPARARQARAPRAPSAGRRLPGPEQPRRHRDTGSRAARRRGRRAHARGDAGLADRRRLPRRRVTVGTVAAPQRERLTRRLDRAVERFRALPVAARIALPVAFLTGFSLALRTMAIHGRYWIDEGISVGIASHPLDEIPGLLRQDGSPPLYYLLLGVWMRVFGHGEADTHALSIGLAVLFVPAAFVTGRALFGARAGWIAAVLGALNPFLTYYAQETRMYSLVSLLGVLVTGAFALAFVQRRRAWLPGFSAALALLIYAHNWGLFLAAGTVVALLALLATERDRAACCATRRSPTARCSSSSRRGCRASCTRPATPGRRGR